MSPSFDAFPLILLVGKDEQWRSGVREALVPLRAAFEVRDTREEAGAAASACAPGLIIVDLRAAEVGAGAGEELCASVGAWSRGAPVLITGEAADAASDPDFVRAEIDADGRLRKPAAGEGLLARARALLDGAYESERWRVLLVMARDEEIGALRDSLHGHGAEVARVASPGEAERVLRAGWDIVVCDLEMPGLDRARVFSWTADAPLTAFVTVASDPGTEAAVYSLRAGASAHLRRPFASDNLAGVCHLAWQKVALARARRMLERRTRELRQSERFLQGVLNASEQIHLVLDCDGRVELFNDATVRICAGFTSRSPCRGARLADFLPEPFRSMFDSGFARALLGEVLQHDADLTDRDGRRRRFIVRYAPLASREDAPPRVCFNAYDITDRAEAEDELRLRNRALGSVSQGVIIAGPDRRVIYVNEGFTAITGYTLREVVGRSCRFIHGPDTNPAFAKTVRERLEQGLPVEGEVLNYRKDGTPFWNELTITPVRNSRGEVTRFVGVQRDITERKLQRDALGASQARLQALFDHSHDGILLAADDGTCLAANPAASALLGRSHEEMLGLRLHEVFGRADQAWAEAAWREFLDVGKQFGERMLRRPDGGVIRVEFHAIARIQPGVHLVIVRDVTERHTMQERLMRQQRTESVGRLASGVAHDLNNILTPILMAPGLLRPHVAEPGARMLLDTLESGARRGSFIVRQLMTFARGEPGEKGPLDLRDVVRDVAAIVRETFRRDITLEQSPVPDGRTFPMHGDRNQLHQAVLNLALNAADAMPRGGRMVLMLEQVELVEADIAGEAGARPGSHAVITVVDHGTGIAPEDLDKIFDPFFTTKPFGKGSGLGLSVALGIARGHGGFVRVSSRPGAGTIVRLHLPLRPAPALAAPPPPAPPAAPSGAGRAILVVDDEAPVREVLRGTLARAGYEVLCAAGADAAFSQLRVVGARLDLVLTDLDMPGVSGAQFIEMLRVRRPDTPVLVLTGTDAGASLPPALLRAVVGVVTKPCEAAVLLDAVARALRPAAGARSILNELQPVRDF